MVDGDEVSLELISTPEGGAQGLPLSRVTAHLDETDVGQLEREKGRRGQACALKALRHSLGLGLTKHQGRDGGGVDDLNGVHAASV